MTVVRKLSGSSAILQDPDAEVHTLPRTGKQLEEDSYGLPLSNQLDLDNFLGTVSDFSDTDYSDSDFSDNYPSDTDFSDSDLSETAHSDSDYSDTDYGMAESESVPKPGLSPFPVRLDDFHYDSVEDRFSQNSLRLDSKNQEGFNQDSFDQDSFNPTRMDQSGFHQDSLNQDRFQDENFNQDSFNQANLKQDSFKTDNFNQDSFNQDSFDGFKDSLSYRSLGESLTFDQASSGQENLADSFKGSFQDGGYALPIREAFAKYDHFKPQKGFNSFDPSSNQHPFIDQSQPATSINHKDFPPTALANPLHLKPRTPKQRFFCFLNSTNLHDQDPPTPPTIIRKKVFTPTVHSSTVHQRPRAGKQSYSSDTESTSAEVSEEVLTGEEVNSL